MTTSARFELSVLLEWGRLRLKEYVGFGVGFMLSFTHRRAKVSHRERTKIPSADRDRRPQADSELQGAA